MHVNLTPKLDEFVLDKVKSGRYNNASEVVRDALRRMQDEEARQSRAISNLTPEEIEDIRASVQQGFEEIRRGEGTDYEGEEGLKRFLGRVRGRAVRELSAERRRRARR